MATLLFTTSLQQEKIQHFCSQDPYHFNDYNLCTLNDFTSSLELEIYLSVHGSFDIYNANRTVILGPEKKNRVKEVVFENCKITDFPENFFERFDQVDSLTLKYSGLQKLKNTDFKNTMDLMNVVLTGNNIKMLKNSTFSKAIKLQYLDLSQNIIETIENEAFGGIRNLIFLDLSENKLKAIPVQLLNLYKINLMLDNNSKKSLNLSFNEIEEFPMLKDSLVIVHQLLLNNNKIKHFNCINVNSMEINLNDNIIELFSLENCSIGRLSIANNNLSKITISQSLEKLNIKNNKIEEIEVEDGAVLEELLLTGNRADNVKTLLADINNLEKLRTLDLSDGIIGSFNAGCFTNLEKLKTLSLRNTSISHLQFGTFINQRELTSLDISYNDLNDFDFILMNPLTQLKILKMNGNNLTSFEPINSIKNILPAIELINLSNNNWDCSDLYTFLQLMKAHDIINLSDDSVHNSSNVAGIKCSENKREIKLNRELIKELKSIKNQLELIQLNNTNCNSPI